MKTYCKTVDITDRKLIQKAVYKCLKKKYKRRDLLTMFSEYTGLPTDTIKGMFNEFGLNGMKPMVETVVDGVREEIIQGNIHFQPIWYKEKIDIMEQIMNYVKPELVVVAVVLYFIGIGLKKSETVADKYIPAILGAVGVVVCGIYVVATCDLKGTQNIAMAIFTAIVQGILVAGLSNYVNQVFKQLNKAE